MANSFNPPAVCPNGHVFKSPISIGGNSSVTLAGNATTCPVCGELAGVVDAVYETEVQEDGRLRVHVKALDEAQLKRLHGMLTPEIEPEQVAELAKVEKDPKLKKILSFVAKNALRIRQLVELIEEYGGDFLGGL